VEVRQGTRPADRLRGLDHRQLAVSQNYRYRPVIETARRVLASGELGVLVDFAAALREGRAAPTNAADNLRTVEMVLAAVEAAAVIA
jgi:predicted dehydrogenase